MAEAVVAGRLIGPGSDLATWNWVRNRSGTGELTEPALVGVGRNRVSEISDRLLACRPALERRLREVARRAFLCEHQLFLLDLTNFHMEGQALGNSLAAHGKSKQKRHECLLPSPALAVDSRGFPLFSEAHLLVAVLAYHLPASIEHRLRQCGDNRRWRAVRDLLLTHRRDSSIFIDDQWRIHHIRQTGAPEKAYLDIHGELAAKHRMARVHEAVAKGV